MDNNFPVLSSFALSVAGIKVAIESISELNKSLANRYHQFLTDDPPQMTIRVHWIGRDRSQISAFVPEIRFTNDQIIVQSHGYQGWIDESGIEADLTLSSDLPIEVIDYFIRIVYAVLTLKNGGLLLHGAGIVRKGQAFVFFGHSGSGKTTVARLSPGDIVLNDDLVILMPQARGWAVYGTPFWNPTQEKPSSQSAPVKALFHLFQDKTVSVQSMRPAQALAELVASVPVLAADPRKSSLIIERVLNLLGTIPAFRLHFLPDDSFWRAIENL